MKNWRFLKRWFAGPAHPGSLVSEADPCWWLVECAWQMQGDWGAGIMYSFCLALGRALKVQSLPRGHLISCSVLEGCCSPLFSHPVPSSSLWFLPSQLLTPYLFCATSHGPSASCTFPPHPARNLTFLAASFQITNPTFFSQMNNPLVK